MASIYVMQSVMMDKNISIQQVLSKRLMMAMMNVQLTTW